MPILFAVLKVIAVLLLILAALLVTAMMLPLGFAVEYRPGRLRVSAVYGPLRRTIWSRRARHKAPAADNKPPAPPSSATKEEASKAQSAAEVEGQQKAEGRPSHPGEEHPPAQTDAAVPPQAVPKPAPMPQPPLPSEDEEETSSGAILGRLERILELLTEDPRALANCVLGHMRWLHRHSFFKIQIRHLRVFWTVTCEDAARTAVVYGAEMAALNTLLALVQQTVILQSDQLWLEPDFVGTRRAERRISCTVSAKAILMFHLLYRIWKDPLLQPVPQTEPQTL